ncbi:MAG: hypothetical protein COA42_14205 [Alteromonadaceae bacterium]|nr:MAG: hypothetical protein COA42_14205 [Alteromonadaceae bacterium]
MPLPRIFTLVFFILFSSHSLSQMSLDKRRILFSDGDRRDEISAMNISSEFQSFRISITDMEMTENGRLKTADNYAFSAREFIRVGPRLGKNVPPGSAQKFRVLKRSQPEEDGEYRTHITIETLLPPAQDHDEGFLVRPSYRYSIPVIIRVGELEATAKILSPMLEEHKNNATRKVTFTLYKDGNRSIYGDVELIDAESNLVIKKQKGFAVYAEIDQAKFFIDVTDVTLPNNLLLRFSEDPEFGGNAIAETNFTL